MNRILLVSLPVLLLVAPLSLGAEGAPASDWAPAGDRLLSRFAGDVDPENCWPEYPRPQMVRPRWKNLNGLWDLAIVKTGAERPAALDKRVLVPFPIESALSGLAERVGPNQTVWYRRTFEAPAEWAADRVLVHFGAVDWQARVWLNGKLLGKHRGGYTPFSFDATAALRRDGANELVVAVEDPTSDGPQPRGKQDLNPRGIWYTPSTGIWQTVWLEPVPEVAINRLRILPDAANGSVSVRAFARGAGPEDLVEVEVLDGDRRVALAEGPADKPLVIVLPDAKLWSPDRPHLYGLRVRLVRELSTLDEVESYCGIRSIRLGTDANGMVRMLLNGEPLFQMGPLDQGFWPDGLYTPPTEEAMRFDLELAKRLGFNMVRKHVKVESARWFHLCDKMGLLVWQDMPSGDDHAPWPRDGAEINRSFASAEQYRQELREMVDFAHNAPSVVVWVPFNEAWGQFETVETTAWMKEFDPSRLVISASGGNDFGVGDADDDHNYPNPIAPPAETGRASILGEYGGLGLPLAGHTWTDQANWGYRRVGGKEELERDYLALIDQLRGLAASHLSAAVYTQITDVEVEVNGLATYDREVVKVDVEKLAEAHRSLYAATAELDAPARVAASTLAWWRFEEAPQGSRLTSLSESKGTVAVVDSSGRGNHVYAFSPQSSPELSTQTPTAPLAESGISNRGSLDDRKAPSPPAKSRDLFTDPILSRTHMNKLDRYPLSAWTVELSVKVDRIGDRMPLLAKKGLTTGVKRSPFTLAIREDGLLAAEVTDGSGATRDAVSGRAVIPGEWMHVAATSDGKTLRLYLKGDDGAPYTLEAETPTDGALVRSAGTWAVGRGFYNGRLGRDSRAMIDEVRIGARALLPEELLFAPR